VSRSPRVPHLLQRSRQNSVGNNQANLPSEVGKLEVGPPWTCAYPKGCIYNNGCNAEHILITKEDISAGAEAVVKITCSNENCEGSPYMHTACFQAFEETALAFLRGQGRAKGWSDKQKLQNLWTKRGYDLVYKACECLCGHGHLRKDLDFIPNESPMNNFAMENLAIAEESSQEDKKQRKRKKTKSGSSGPTTITIGLPTFTQSNVKRSEVQNVPSNNVGRNRTNSVSSITSGSSTGSSSNSSITTGQSPSSNEGFHPPPRRAALLQDNRTRVCNVTRRPVSIVSMILPPRGLSLSSPRSS